jgi:hypothetical protein
MYSGNAQTPSLGRRTGCIFVDPLHGQRKLTTENWGRLQNVSLASTNRHGPNSHPEQSEGKVPSANGAADHANIMGALP